MTKVTMPEPFGYARDGLHGGGLVFQHKISEMEALVCSTRPLYTADQAEAYATAMVREALALAAATVAKGINERSSLTATVTRRNAASEILALTP